MLAYETITTASHPTTPTKLLLTVPEAAKVLGLSRSILYELLLAGEIRSLKIGRSRRLTHEALQEFITRQVAQQCPSQSL